MGRRPQRATTNRNRRSTCIASALCVWLLAAPVSEVGGQTPPTNLAGKSWQLVRIQSMDDKIATPDSRSKNTIAFGNRRSREHARRLQSRQADVEVRGSRGVSSSSVLSHDAGHVPARDPP